MTEKSIFREAWNPELKTKKHGEENIKTWGRKIAIKKFFCYTYQHIGEI